MALSFKRFWKGINIVPKNDPTADSRGDLEVINSDGTLKYHNGVSSSSVLTEEHLATLENKNISADDNSITELEVDNLKAGVLNVDLNSGPATDTEIPSAKAVQDYIESNVQVDVDDLIALSGVPANSTDLGTFTGVDIPDNSTIKEALQALEDEKVTHSHDAIESGIPVFTGDGSNKITQSALKIENTVIEPIEITDDLHLDGKRVIFDSFSLRNNGGLELPVTAGSVGSGPSTLQIFDGKNVLLNPGMFTSIDSIKFFLDSDEVRNSGREITVINGSGTDISIINNGSTSGDIEDSIITGLGKDIKLKVGQSLNLVYVTEMNRWFIVGGTGGGSTSIISTAGETIVKGDILYISKGSSFDSGRILGRAYKADASNDNRIEVIGVAAANAALGTNIEILVAGVFDEAIGLSTGSMYFLSTTVPGSMTTTPPSNDGEWAVSLGVASSATEFVINPSASASAQYISGNERTYIINNNQSTFTPLVGLVIDPLVYRGGIIQLAVKRVTSSAEVCDNREFRFSFNSMNATSNYSEHYAGEDTGVDFQIEPSGQISYRSTNLVGGSYVGTVKVFLDKMFTK